jgi:hypothetical protein
MFEVTFVTMHGDFKEEITQPGELSKHANPKGSSGPGITSYGFTAAGYGVGTKFVLRSKNYQYAIFFRTPPTKPNFHKFHRVNMDHDVNWALDFIENSDQVHRTELDTTVYNDGFKIIVTQGQSAKDRVKVDISPL